MKKIIITGMSGFIGGWLQKLLKEDGKNSVIGLSHKNCNLKDYYDIRFELDKIKPDVVFHLASQASPYVSWKSPYLTVEDNVVSTLNIMRCAEEMKFKLVIAGSSEIYDPKTEKLNEASKIHPRNPYGISKATVDYLAQIIAPEKKINATLLRSFNNIGPGQSDMFVVSTFSKQLALIKLEKKEPEILVGNLDARRDFVDVRDAVRAFKLVSELEEYGECYNVCSGKSYKIEWILEQLIKISGLDVTIKYDFNRSRPSDIPVFIGDFSKLNKKVGWQPTIPIEQTLSDSYNHWLQKLKEEQ
jgi:GDP-4-dehydro-6-deoxy-D-mannose reductase